MEASAVDVAPCCSDSIGAGQQRRTHGGYWLTKTSKNLILGIFNLNSQLTSDCIVAFLCSEGGKVLKPALVCFFSSSKQLLTAYDSWWVGCKCNPR
ncbi:hypothetical protein NC653_029319 [Populus alba x Populus x berolinensis]|uniref:Uncharacterized protein n=1 Tax=Populus alba x Populus x berolinensis TaxID=444605 RepID=A0AAD6Q3B1_9ROSI|nr:hypothetical protein NC653_029319 [Populus alba x Populus x berolinensis]